ncbi:MAG TPA: histone deacetylase family protein [Ferrovibrio sp.]|jgi:acetoin utilization deacetylase AcuC-like enzyme|uniref:histone deacetylase family protein n=1 Tax=Ferrovibrio sp. TaxID=1917215 RepID=UPI002B4AB35A|nr:histone deacetylase family protein [Ferrovibrio sp.]HLT78958.1 histone deacetylase family protein [Ferrovibrio sp.]
MVTGLFSHSACFAHDTGEGHPECAERLRAVLAALEAEDFAYLDRREAPRATAEQLSRVHPGDFVERMLQAIPESGLRYVDGDTIVSPGSGEAALRAAGAVCAAIDAVMAGELRNAFCAVRPPGHHAEPAQAMGFCLFNNVAVGALHARDRWKLRRIAVVDFDVHHGNGTQAVFEADADLFYASTHQFPLYPGTGARHENGVAGNVVNLPLRPFAGSAEFREAVENILLPRLEAFAPELLLISAGFDAHRADPLAQLQLTDDDYHWVTEQLLAVARKTAQGRVVSALEGGYALSALASASAAHVRALMLG